MQKLILAVSFLALAGAAAHADPIADRQALMKERGGIVRGLSRVVKGEAPFDAAAVLTELQKLHANAEKFDVDALFPAGSDTGGKTEASPKIWEDIAAFKAEGEKFTAVTASAVAAAPQDVGALKTQFDAIGAECGACHRAYQM